MRLLLVEDAADVAETVAGYLGREGYACDVAGSEAAAADHLGVQTYDLVLLDIHLPDGDGRRVLRGMRRRGDATPVIMLSANYSVETRVGSLDEGADDYLVKPFDLRELSARVRALTRRGTERVASETPFGDLLFDLSAHSLRLKGEPVAMTRRELALFDILLRNANRIISKERLFQGLFSFDDADIGLNAIELYVARIRKKLAGSEVRIRTHRGLGYALEGPGGD